MSAKKLAGARLKNWAKHRANLDIIHEINELTDYVRTGKGPRPLPRPGPDLRAAADFVKRTLPDLRHDERAKRDAAFEELRRFLGESADKKFLKLGPSAKQWIAAQNRIGEWLALGYLALLRGALGEKRVEKPSRAEAKNAGDKLRKRANYVKK